MKTIGLLQLGLGNVGQEMIRTIDAYNACSIDIQFNYIGFANSRSYYTPQGHEWEHHGDLSQILPLITSSGFDHLCVLDLTASGQTTDFLIECADRGTTLVLANKKPLVGSMENFNRLRLSRLGCRATVGSGLPVIEEINEIISTGGKIVRAEGCFSGTLGTLFTALEKGDRFSDIIREAHQKGFTEPDPRDDLSGMDVARKILIIARMMDLNLELDQLETESLFPKSMSNQSTEEFLLHLSELDELYQKKVDEAHVKNRCLRYVARIENGVCSVGIREVSKNFPLGQLRDDQKMVLLQTDHPGDPIIIRGAGSGAKDTTKDLLKDLIEQTGFLL